MTDILAPFAYLLGKPTATAKVKAQPQDFQVVENLGFEFKSQGEHLMVQIEKCGENTSFVANELAKACGVASKSVGWAGLKDRHAVTTQWLSVHQPQGGGFDSDAFMMRHPSIKILATSKHDKKLRPGDLIGNQFTLRLAEVSDLADVIARLEQLKITGVPNYFGEQRFGREGNNLSEARRWGRDNVRTRDQNKRSLYLSTARSWIFNQVLSARIENAQYQKLMLGDIVIKAQQQQRIDEENIVENQQLLLQGQLELTAPLAGDNALPTRDQALLFEQPFLDNEPDLMALIRGNRMRHDRRALSLQAQDLIWHADGDDLILSFALPAGCFATSILRELVEQVEIVRKYD